MTQFIVIAYDGKDAEAPARRQAARESHMALLAEAKAAGHVLYAAAIVTDEVMHGSVVITDFPARAAFDAWLRAEPYVVQNVWQDVTVHEGRVPPLFHTPSA